MFDDQRRDWLELGPSKSAASLESDRIEPELRWVRLVLDVNVRGSGRSLVKKKNLNAPTWSTVAHPPLAFIALGVLRLIVVPSPS